VKAINRGNGHPGLIGTLKVEFVSGDPALFSTGPGWQASQTEGGDWSAVKDLGAYGIEPWAKSAFPTSAPSPPACCARTSPSAPA